MKINKHFVYILLLSLSSFWMHSQDKQPEKIAIVLILNEIADLHNITFNYESGLLDNITVYPISTNLTLSEKLKSLENQTQLIFSKISNAVISITKPMTICGYIEDTNQNILSGATINVGTNFTVSDETGYFEIQLKSRREVVEIRFMGFKTISREVLSFNKTDCEQIILTEDEQIISAVVVVGYIVPGIDKMQDGTTTIDFSKFTLLPGLIESDVLQSIQALPGVLSVDETVSNINIRGGSNDQNLILWDDIKMYQSGHFFGLISSFNPLITKKTTIIHNGTAASLSDGVSGSILMQSENIVQNEFKGSFGLNFLNSDVFFDIPIGNLSSVQISGRKSTDAIIRTPTYKSYFDRITQNTEAQANTPEVSNSNQDFSFYDTSIRWLYKPSNKDYIRLNFILLNNNLTFDETALFNNQLETKESSVSQNSLAAGIYYKRKWSEKSSSTLNIYNTDYQLKAVNANILANQRFMQENVVSETALKLENSYEGNLWHFKWGYNFVESEIVNLTDVDLPRFLVRDSEVLREYATYVEAKFENTKKDFSIQSGIRINYLDEFKEVIVEPRLIIHKKLGEHFEIEVLGEFKHQTTSQTINFQNDFLGIEKRRWQQSDNDSIPILKSRQASLGILYKEKGWLVDVKGYLKKVGGITTQSQSFTTKYELERELGSYDAFGIELLIRKKIRNVSSWLSYSYINNAYTFENLQEIQFPSNFDITHSFTFGTTFSNKYWNISSGINYRTGKPTSIPLIGNEVINNNVNFDLANNENLDDYIRVDASMLYKFKISNSFRAEIGSSVWNLLNTKNPINNFYRINNENVPIQFSRYALGTTLNAVFRIYF